MNAPQTNDPLDALLREADNYVADDGFTARVLAALPARRHHAWLRLAILSGGLLLAGLLAAWQLPLPSEILNAVPRNLLAVRWQTVAVLLPVLAALASLLWGAFALVSEEE